jgi:uncharacterized protein (DUF1684 family)
MTACSRAYVAELDAWKADRLAKLIAPDGWINLTDRVWLQTGQFRVGSSKNNDVVLSTGPDFIGVLTQAETGEVTFSPADGGAPFGLKRDPKYPPRFSAGNLLLEITMTNGENALRVRDTTSTRLQNFPGLEYFPPDPNWRVMADWVPFVQPLDLTINTSKSIPSDVRATHKAVFRQRGQCFELIATHGTPEAPQFVFRDQTAKDMTYSAARFLIGEHVTETTIVLDFNKAYSPPCAFTEYAVCPLPPAANVLPVRIEAGEMRPRQISDLDH